MENTLNGEKSNEIKHISVNNRTICENFQILSYLGYVGLVKPKNNFTLKRQTGPGDKGFIFFMQECESGLRDTQSSPALRYHSSAAWRETGGYIRSGASIKFITFFCIEGKGNVSDPD
jgi:hypothetical protein